MLYHGIREITQERMIMDVGQRVVISDGTQPTEFVGLVGEIASIEIWGYEVLLDGDGFETPFYAHELELVQTNVA